MTRHDLPAGAGHVGHDDLRLSGKVVAEMTRDQPCVSVESAARRRADSDGDGLFWKKDAASCASAALAPASATAGSNAQHHERLVEDAAISDLPVILLSADEG
jgi:hypothetical protein